MLGLPAIKSILHPILPIHLSYISMAYQRYVNFRLQTVANSAETDYSIKFCSLKLRYMYVCTYMYYWFIYLWSKFEDKLFKITYMYRNIHNYRTYACTLQYGLLMVTLTTTVDFPYYRWVLICVAAFVSRIGSESWELWKRRFELWEGGREWGRERERKSYTYIHVHGTRVCIYNLSFCTAHSRFFFMYVHVHVAILLT